jgi:heterodisulfide reductase subunit B
LTGANKAYHNSLAIVFQDLEIALDEIPDWNCCGTTAYLATKEIQALGLTARNLAIASEMGNDEVIVPCNGCFTNFRKTNEHMKTEPAIRKKIDRALEEAGLNYKTNVGVRHPLDILVNEIGEEQIRKRVKRPLEGLRVAPYYGCQTTRPFGDFDDPEYPMILDHIMSWTGATVVPYQVKTKCCGGTLITTNDDVVEPLIHHLVENAREVKADVIVTCCPLCQTNLETFQPQINKRFKAKTEVPVLYFAQLLAYSMGRSFKEADIGREIVDAKKLLKPYLEAGVAHEYHHHL